jgi:hypothetical protein
MTTHLFIGIDPGAKGAWALLDSTGSILALHDFPGDEVSLCQQMATYELQGARGALEFVHSMPGQGVASTFKFGANFGIWRGVLAALRVPFELVRPQIWKREFIKPSDATGKKSAELVAASRLFPGAPLHGPRGGVLDGRAEALLIAEWLRRKAGMFPEIGNKSPEIGNNESFVSNVSAFVSNVERF